MEQSNKELKERLIKEYMSSLQSNEERLAELKGLTHRELPGTLSAAKEEQKPGKQELPSPAEMQEALLGGHARTLEMPELPKPKTSTGLGGEERSKKKIATEEREG